MLEEMRTYITCSQELGAGFNPNVADVDNVANAKSRAYVIDTGVQAEGKSNRIPEESPIKTVISTKADNELTNKEAATNHSSPKKYAGEDAKERDNRRKAADCFRFVEAVEETKMMDKFRSSSSKPAFIRNYTGDEEDWTDNHFFYRDGREDNTCKVLFTSYQFKRLVKNCSRTSFCSDAPKIDVNERKEKDNTFYYIQAEKSVNVLPVPNFVPEAVQEYLDYLKLMNIVDKGSSLDSVLASFTEEELETMFQKPNDPGVSTDLEVLQYIKDYRKALVDRDLKLMFKPLYDWQGGSVDKTKYELRLGLGHVRKIYSRKNAEERKILNAPLIEVPVDVDEESLKIVPVQGGRLKWNGEAKATLLFAGGKRKKVLADFQTLVADGSPLDVILGCPETFLGYIEKASEFCWHGVVKKPTDKSLHQFPEDTNALVLTAEWCVFVRPKRSNSLSNDVHTFAKAIGETPITLPSPCRSLILGLDDARPEDSKDASDDSKLVLPFPASENQLKIIKEVLSENNCVSIIQGPPGTGKTQTGLNMASVVLQRGSTCLVTSDNPRALEAFENKLPKKLSIFCINMSSMEEEGIGKLSKTFDCRDADLSALFEGKGGYEKNIKELHEDIDKKKGEEGKCIEDQMKRNDISRRLMKTSGFCELVKHALRADAEMCRVIRCILQHDDLGGLSNALVNLSDKKRSEVGDGVSLECSFETITQDLIDVAEMNAMPVGHEPKDKRHLGCIFHSHSQKRLKEQLSSLKLCVDKQVNVPVTTEHWSLVAKCLKLKKSESDFQEDYVKPLVARGCPETLIYGPDGMRQEFINTVAYVERSLCGVEPGNRDNLLKLLEDISINRKTQESQRNLSLEIRKLEEELVYMTIAHNQSSSITTSDLGNFSQLKELTSRMKDSEIDAAKGSDATLRRQAKFAEKFRKSLGCMPLLLMTTEQVSRYIPVNHCFDFVIADEASQSPSSTALTILGRAKKAVVIGDSRQTLPKDDLSEESRSALEKCGGDLEIFDLFMPGDGNSLFDVCQNSFPQSNSTLRDHFRCPPDGMSWSNKEVYGNRMVLYKPSISKATLCLKITKGGKEGKTEMMQFVYELVQEAISSDVVDQVVLTIGVIMMGPKSEVKPFKEELDNMLTPLENMHGTDAVDRHNIKVAIPQDFQGQERDIILIGCVSDKSKVPHENDPDRRRLWNVATTRHRRQSVIFSSFTLEKIKRDDHKRQIFMRYNQLQSHTSLGGFKEGKQDIRSMAEDRLFDQLSSHGYEASRNKATIWNNSLSIGLKGGSISDSNALVVIENYGESEDEWKKVFKQQADLEEAGIACLRVDALALSLHFHAVFDDVVSFLQRKVGLYPPMNAIQSTKRDSINAEGKKPSSRKPRKRPSNRASSKTSAAKRGKNH